MACPTWNPLPDFIQDIEQKKIKLSHIFKSNHRFNKFEQNNQTIALFYLIRNHAVIIDGFWFIFSSLR